MYIDYTHTISTYEYTEIILHIPFMHVFAPSF